LRTPPILLILAALAACAGPNKTATRQAPPPAATTTAATSLITGPQIPPVELGRRPRNARMTSANMPFFDTVAYCEHTTRKIDKMPRGPAYEACVEDQAHYRIVIGQAVDARQFKDTAVTNCAKASRTAYQGLWYCMNGQLF
jgi:hypothetical protein